MTRRLLGLVLLAAFGLALTPLSAVAKGSASATIAKTTRPGQVQVTFHNDGDAPLVGFRLIAPAPYSISSVGMQGANCSIVARDEIACNGYSVAPGGSWSAFFETPPVYSNETGTNVTYYPPDGPSTFYVTAADGESGPFSATWSEAGAPTAPRAELGIAGYATSPAVPRAGKRFTARLQVSTTDPVLVSALGTVRCDAKAGGTTLRATGRRISENAVASCSWRLPRGAKGKLLRATVLVSYEGAAVRRTFTLRIR